MQDLDPIEIEVAMKVAKAIDDSQNLDTSLKDLDKSVDNVKKKFKQKTEELNRNTQAKKTQTQTTRQQTEATQKQTQATKQQNDALTKSTQKFNALGNSVNQITRELPAFTYSAQTGFMAIANNIPILTDAMAKLRAENEQLKAAGQKTTPVWKQLLGSFLSWNTLLSVGITLLTVYGKEIGNFVGSLFKGKDAVNDAKASIEAINKGFESTTFQKASKDILQLRAEFESARKGVVDKDKALKNYNKTVGDVMGRVNSFADAEKKLINQGDAYVKMMLYKAAALASLDKANTKIIEIEERKLELENSKKASDATSYGRHFINKRQNKAIKEANKEIQTLEKSSINVYNNILGKAKEVADKFNLNLFGDEKDKDKDTSKIENEYKKLLEKIAELDKEYSKQSFDKHDTEIQALKDKFAKVRTLVEEFNKTPNNKLKIGIDQLNTLEDKAIATLKYRQETENLKKELNKQKELFAEYESYKTKVGGEEADRRFKNELKGFSSYTHLLETLIRKTQESGANSPERSERLRELQAMLLLANENESKQQRNKFADLLEEYKGFNEKRLTIDYQYYDDLAILEQQRNEANANAVDEAIKVRKAKYEEDLANLEDSVFKSKDFYKRLFGEIRELSNKEIKLIIAESKKALNESTNISQQMRKDTLKRIEELEKGFNKRKLDDIYSYSRAIGDLAKSLEKLSNSIDNSALSDAGALIGGLASNINGLLTMFDKSSSNSDKISAGIGALANIIDMVASASERRRQAEEQYYHSVIGFQQQYNLSLLEQQRIQSQLAENSFVKDYVGRVRDGVKAVHEVNKKQQDEIRKLIKSGQVKVGQRNVIDWGNVGKGAVSGVVAGAAIGSVIPVIGNAIGAAVGGVVGAVAGLFGGKKKKDVFTNILQEYKELVIPIGNGLNKINIELAKSLKDNGLVNEETKQILTNIIQWEEELKKSREQIKGVVTELSGKLGDDLKNNLVESFKAGEDAAIKMGETVEKVVENMLSSLIFHQIFNDTFTKLENEMQASQDIGGDGNWVDDFGRFYKEMQEKSHEFNRAMAQAQKEAERHGIKAFAQKDDNSSRNSLKGAVRGITEQQADLLAGQFGGLRIAQLETNKINKQGFAETMAQTSKMIGIQLEIQHNTRRTADNTEAMKESLKNIETSVKSNKNDLKGNGIKP
ncbi:hypothetical protein ACILD6_00110 [Capnocytophaga canimorsus]|uniref:hypothetical protein n=1 Tax=Capnocytophaga canimorsus TaxID=28188 RepID=UPI0037D64B59